jgi:hypothetical protein
MLFDASSGRAPLQAISSPSDKVQYIELNAFDLIAAVFYSGILPLKMAF